MPTISVLIERAPGSLARVVASLRKTGLSFRGHHLEPTSDPAQSLLTLSVDGRVVGGELAQALSEVRGVLQILRVDTNSAAGHAERTRPRSMDTRHSAGPEVVEAAAIKPEELAERIITAYPRILPLIENFEDRIQNNSDRSRRLTKLGERVGKGLAAPRWANVSAETVHEALQRVVVPALEPIADAEAHGADLRVRISIFTRRQTNTMDLVFGGEAARCDFMVGMIQGMINASSSLPHVTVDEARCRTNGDEYCLFRVNL